jgi:hypothetical protein
MYSLIKNRRGKDCLQKIEASSESALSDEEKSDSGSTILLDRFDLGALVRVVDLAMIGGSLVAVLLTLDVAGLLVVWRAGPQTSKALLKPFGSILVTLDLTILTASIHSPEIELPGKWKK